MATWKSVGYLHADDHNAGTDSCILGEKKKNSKDSNREVRLVYKVAYAESFNIWKTIACFRKI